MKIIKLSELMESESLKSEFLQSVKAGDVFVYPTDTVYGIGCNIENLEGIKRIIEAKKRDPRKPLSVIAPSINWILENCQVSEFNKSLLNQLFPGPYTAVLRAQKDTKLPKQILSNENTVGVRIPRHKLTDLISGSGLIIVSTSVNLSGKEPVTKVEEIPEEIQKIVAVAVDAGQLSSESSRVFDLTTDEIKILRW